MTATPHAPTWVISLQWTTPTQQLQYYKSSLNGTLVTALAGDTQSHTLSWLELGVSHLIEVQAYDFEHNLVAEGQVHSLAGDSEAPSQPQAISIRRSGDFRLQLDWQPSTDNHGIKHYVIFRNGEAYTHVNNNSFVDTWPPAGQNYYQVQAVDLYENQSQLSTLVAAPLINY